ncbi:hypothetical protein [Spelaeicoccus albus]|uniref:DUF8083 domain-containing protein n=1 Tax=Spelaeicoccus albus TaxID=1280376 RepID=A0A7Z0A801_9MICO|nr:hypothetical protein [Spelaeicoccus albus]NYI66124.1 hypothetical protein [Spelaeicoccus albus]
MRSSIRGYETYLRVFEPLSAHPELEPELLAVERGHIEARSDEAADRRLLTTPVNPIPAPDETAVLSLPAGTCGDDVDRVCPVQEQMRSWHALDALEQVWPESAIDLVAPPSVRRAAAADRADWALSERDSRVFTRMATWEVPLSWFVVVDTDQDLADTSDGVRVRTPMVAAQSRAEWAAEIVTEHLAEEDLVTELAELVAWLDNFDLGSIVELDYGGLGNLVWPDPSTYDVHEGIQALSEGDGSGAIAAYQRFAHRWHRVAALARAS